MLCVLVESECSVGIKDRNMGGGRKNLKRAAEGEESIALQEGQSIIQVEELPGSSVIEVMDATGEKLLAFFPAKFLKSMWIKRDTQAPQSILLTRSMTRGKILAQRVAPVLASDSPEDLAARVLKESIAGSTFNHHQE
ncbi:hypothetical protein Droror1_Dr00015877 [Drosera rotundifolia]